jgi:hypothetical protein
MVAAGEGRIATRNGVEASTTAELAPTGAADSQATTGSSR